MATIPLYLAPEEAAYLASAFPQFVRNQGTNYPVTGLAFDGTTAERAYWKFNPALYGSGSITVDVLWYADSGTTGAVVWEAALAAITPNTDTTDIETKALATAAQVADSHLGTTAQRLHLATITLSGASLDSVAVGDECWLRISRLPADAGDTMTAIDAILTSVRLSYSDS
jgi:hypothetical protein